MKNVYISEEILLVVKKIAEKFPDTVFCGSFGLVINEKLKRDVVDLDILVDRDYYSQSGFFDEFRVSNVSNVGMFSEKFMVGKNEVKSFRLFFPIFDKNVKVDVLYNKEFNPNYKLVDIDQNLTIKVETPESAIKAKLGYIINDKSQKSFLKHLKDLIYMEVDKNLIINAIDRSEFGGMSKKHKSKKLY